MNDAVLFNEKVEQCVLGAILINNECYFQYQANLKKDLFYMAKNARLFEAIKSLFDDGQNVDTLTVLNWMAAHPDELNMQPIELFDIANAVVSSVMFREHVLILANLLLRRNCRELADKLHQASIDPSITPEELLRQTSNVENLLNSNEEPKEVSMAEANAKLTKRINDIRAGKATMILKTGFKEIDERVGFAPTELQIIAAETSMGKTTLALNIAVNMARDNRHVYYISLEMNGEELSSKINAAVSGVSSGMMYKHPESLTTDDLRALEQAQGETSKLTLTIDQNTSYTPESVIAIIREKLRRGYQVVFLDYLQQLFQNNNGDGNQESMIGAFIRRLKNLCMEYKACIVAVSQLNRNAANPKPSLSRLRGSGQLEETANNILLIWRPTARGLTFTPAVDDAEHKAEIIIAKARASGVGSFFLGFDGRLSKFYDLSLQPIQEKMKKGQSKKNGESNFFNNGNTTENEDDGTLPF